MRLRTIIQDIAYQAHKVGDLLVTANTPDGDNHPNFFWEVVRKTGGKLIVKAIPRAHHKGRFYCATEQKGEPEWFRAKFPEEK